MTETKGPIGKRKNPRHDQKTRDKIQASQIVNRLQKHIDADEEIMTPSQVNAALGLLKKTLPDLKQVELSGGLETTVIIKDLSGEYIRTNH